VTNADFRLRLDVLGQMAQVFFREGVTHLGLPRSSYLTIHYDHQQECVVLVVAGPVPGVPGAICAADVRYSRALIAALISGDSAIQMMVRTVCERFVQALKDHTQVDDDLVVIRHI
jgi:hypothetical protein